MEPNITQAIDQGTPLDLLKTLSSSVIKSVAVSLYGTVPLYLELEPHRPLPDLDLEVLRTFLLEAVASLSNSERAALYHKVWELAKMQDPRIHGPRWGELHALDDLPRLYTALCRLGHTTADAGSAGGGGDRLHRVEVLPFQFGEGGIGAQYYSLGERLGRDPEVGRIGWAIYSLFWGPTLSAPLGPLWCMRGLITPSSSSSSCIHSFINGMGVPTLEHAGRDAVVLSDRFFGGTNLHAVYNPTHQAHADGSLTGFARDALRMKAVEGGATSKQAYLLAQLWLDYLHAHPRAKFLQVAHSEGAVHLHGALRLLARAGPAATRVLGRVQVLALCPAHFINPATYAADGLQVVNFVKMEDRTINPWGTGAPVPGRRVGPHVCVVEHRVRHDDVHNDPHDFMSWDYVDAARSWIDCFFQTGDLVAR
ncbi:hypothetical protein HK405_011080 [Cladochytrium tenue]|nr:hypothetical protein HK405_011080 [Cladochytrium tenue]